MKKNICPYQHGDIITIKNNDGGAAFPCVVLRKATLRDEPDTEYIVAMRTNNPGFIRAYEPDISMEFNIGDKRKGFITTSPVFVPMNEVVSVIGKLNNAQMAEFDEMLLKSVGIKTQESSFKDLYYQLKSDIASLIS